MKSKTSSKRHVLRIEKKQTNEERYKRNYYFQNSARECLFEILQQDELRNKRLLLPAFIGYSTNEGSGIFDPVVSSNTSYDFYNFNSQLEINSESLIKELNNSVPGIILFVHYYGFRDKNFIHLKEIAKKNNYIIIEDCAHAYFTFYRKPSYDSDYLIFSLHKMFPFKSGGLLYSKDNKFDIKSMDYHELQFYDIEAISRTRKENYQYLLKKIIELNRDEIKVLRQDLDDNIPQTFPITLPSETIRDLLYYELNKIGLGVVSLYHNLIDNITDEYVNEINLSQTILNLPIHQDVSFAAIDYLVIQINEVILGSQ